MQARRSDIGRSRGVGDGGPAFPVAEFDGQTFLVKTRDELKRLLSGMTLRDYFAAHAPEPPQWWIDGYKSALNDLNKYGQHIAQWNFVYADEMVKEREK